MGMNNKYIKYILPCLLFTVLGFELAYCENLVSWHMKQEKINKYYENKMCAKADCEDPRYECKEYCYDKEVRK